MDSFGKQFKQYILFSFVPTLIYRNSYPRSPKRRWGVVLGHLIEVAACIFFMYVAVHNSTTMGPLIHHLKTRQIDI
jgi:hypothetical protein